MREGRYHQVERACGHTEGHWLDVDDYGALDALEATDCQACERQADKECETALATEDA